MICISPLGTTPKQLRIASSLTPLSHQEPLGEISKFHPLIITDTAVQDCQNPTGISSRIIVLSAVENVVRHHYTHLQNTVLHTTETQKTWCWAPRRGPTPPRRGTAPPPRPDSLVDEMQTLPAARHCPPQAVALNSNPGVAFPTALLLSLSLIVGVMQLLRTHVHGEQSFQKAFSFCL